MLPLFIIGYMASGKTTFGRALARRTGRQFIDLDFFIEQSFHTTISRLFEERGEEGFRSLESAMLREVGELDDVVISCGGGTPCFNANIDYMLSRGNTVLLEASVDRIVERLVANSSRRPLMKGKKPEEIRLAVEEGLASRRPYYDRAPVRFCGEQLEDRRQIDTTVETFLRLHPAL